MQSSNVIKFEANSPDTVDLRCPRCNLPQLHHIGVTVYDRNEDDQSVTKITVNGARTETEVIPNSGSGNPSSRRDGLAISFWCENCGDDKNIRTELTIAQHKGATEMAWRFTPTAK